VEPPEELPGEVLITVPIMMIFSFWPIIGSSDGRSNPKTNTQVRMQIMERDARPFLSGMHNPR
jgi:hypothetical protein